MLITDLRVHPNQIKIPSKGSSFFQSDYHHRIATIQFNIQFQQWVAKKGYRLLLVNTYFNRKYIDGGYLSETRVIHHGKRTEPDAIGVYGDDHRFYTFLFEQHNGMDAKRAIEQINNHCNLLGNSGYTYQIGKRSPVRVAYVFQHSCCMQSVMKKMMESPALRLFKHSFLFKTEEELQQ